MAPARSAKADARMKNDLKKDWPIYANLIEAGNTKVQEDIVNIKKVDILKYRIAQDEEDADPV